MAAGLVENGIFPGEAVAIYMPMTVEAVAIYLGIVKAGAVAVSIADSFAPQEIATRLRIAPVRAVFTQDKVRRGGREFPLLSKVIEAGCDRAIVLPFDEDHPDVEVRETGENESDTEQ